MTTFTSAEAAEITGVKPYMQSNWRSRGFLPPHPGKAAMYDVFGLARLSFIQCLGDRFSLRLVANVADMASVGIARAALSCVPAWDGINRFEFDKRGDKRGWANLVDTAHREHAARRGLPTCNVCRFMLWFADDTAVFTDDFGPELWAQTEADTRTALIVDQHAIGEALAERAVRPLVTYRQTSALDPVATFIPSTEKASA